MSMFKHTVCLESSGICLELVCELEYIKAEGDDWNEPRQEAECILAFAKIGMIDIYESLSKEDVFAIEQKAFEEYEPGEPE